MAADPLSVNAFLSAEEFASFDRFALSKYLADEGFEFDPKRPVHQFAGGLANRTYLVEVDGGPVVLRRPPAGKLPRGAHDMAREQRILTALSPVLPLVPAGLHYCPSAWIIGAPFQLIEYRAGLVLRDVSQTEALNEGQRDEISAMLVRTLATIHAVDAPACGLGTLGRPEGFVHRTISGWAERGRDVVGEPGAIGLIEALLAWLDDQPLSSRPPRLLHLDFKLDNLILDPATLAPRAIVDWDMGTRGDPLFDLATLLSYWPEARDPPELQGGVMMPIVQPGFWTRRQAAEAYAAITGDKLDDLAALYVLARLKLGVVYFQLHQQWLTGATKNARYADFDQRGVAVLDHAHAIASGRREAI
jgi:aminoglycoside phosphotransferase (APT) family kinase protein